MMKTDLFIAVFGSIPDDFQWQASNEHILVYGQ